MKFKVGELVQVLQVPPRQMKWNGRYVGHVGIIEQVIDDGARALVQMIKAPGERDGAMFLAVDCMEPATDPASQSLLALYRRFLEEEARERAEWRRKRREHIEMVAAKHNTSVETAIAILDDVLGYDAQYYY